MDKEEGKRTIQAKHHFKHFSNGLIAVIMKELRRSSRFISTVTPTPTPSNCNGIIG